MPIEKIFSEPLVQIACGQSHTLFLTISGRVFGAGETHIGQLGPLCYSNTGSAALLFSESVPCFYISTGYNFSYMCGVDGTIYCCGSNGNNQLGDAKKGRYGMEEMKMLDFGAYDWGREIRIAGGDVHVVFYNRMFNVG
jgi:alpha-tubulin suppressor-like RCC1 family protein